MICNVSAPSALQSEEDEEEAEADEVPTVGDEEGGEEAAEATEE